MTKGEIRWLTRCPGCDAELPDLDALRARVAEKPSNPNPVQIHPSVPALLRHRAEVLQREAPLGKLAEGKESLGIYTRPRNVHTNRPKRIHDCITFRQE